MISNPRHDIIQKLLADLSRVFAELMGFDTTEALDEIQAYYQEWLGIADPNWKNQSHESLLHFLLEEKKFNIDQLELLARLLAKEGDILANAQQILSAKDHFQKALFIFDHVEKQSTIFSIQRQQLIANLKHHLEQL